jgi:putative protease
MLAISSIVSCAVLLYKPAMTKPKRSELLMPAGSLEKLKIAVLYGADAVYMGTPDLSLRVNSQMSLAQVQEGVAFCHAHGKRAYLTLNLFSHNSDIPKLREYLDAIRQVNPDGVIVADVGVFEFFRANARGSRYSSGRKSAPT